MEHTNTPASNPSPEGDTHRHTLSASHDNVVRLERCTRPYGVAHYRVVVAQLVDKPHASLKVATEHYAKALAAHIRYLFNER